MKLVLFTTTAFAAMAPSMAFAQAAPAPLATEPAPSSAVADPEVSPETDAAAAPEDQGLGEIVITAQRRSESLQRAGVAVSAVQGADLINAGVTQPAELTKLVPALTIQPSSTGNLIFLRGVGNFTQTPNSDPAIAFNYDNVYIGRPTSTSGLFFDLQRIEVLKGPQGTLYGRNATGGAINVIPVQPEMGELSGYASASYGNYNTINAEGALNLPLGETGGFRVSASTSNHDAYLDDGNYDEETSSLRLQLKGELTPDLTVRVAGDYEQTRGRGFGVSYLGRYAFNPRAGAYAFVPSGIDLKRGIYTADSQAFRMTAPAGPSGRTLDAIAPTPFQNNEFYGVNAEIGYRTSFGTLTVIPAWRHASLNFLSEAAAFPYRNREQDEQFSIEARFSGDRIGIFDYTIGGFYYDDSIENRTVVNVSAAENFLNQRYTTESYAPFARLTANLTERFRVIGGLRYTKDIKTFDASSTALTLVCTVRVQGVPTCPTATLFPTVDNPAQLPFPIPAGPQPIPQGRSGAIIVRTNSLYDNRLVDDRVTYRAGVEFDVRPQSLFYASVETGFRSGGFSAAVGFETYDPETITAYTLGLKNRFLDNRLQLNLEAFRWEYRDQQVSHVGLDLTGRTTQFIENIGRSRIQGIEAEARVLVTPDTLIAADVQYLDAKNKFFTYQQGAGGLPPLTGCDVSLDADPRFFNVDCAGRQPYNSPRFTVNVSGQQTLHLGDYDLVLGANTQFKSARNVGFEFLPEQRVDSNFQTNAQAVFGPAGERWSIAAFVRNIEGDRIILSAQTHPLANTLVATTTAPRTYGLRGSIRF